MVQKGKGQPLMEAAAQNNSHSYCEHDCIGLNNDRTLITCRELHILFCRK